MKLQTGFCLLTMVVSMILLLPLIGCRVPNVSSAHEQVVSQLSNEQIRALVDAEFGGLLQVDDQTFFPYYLTGDFNGDGIEDIAVSVRQRYDVDANDRSAPPFWFRELRPVCPPETQCVDDVTYTMGDLARFRDFLMLVVIHGTSEHGWGNTQPQQRFLVPSSGHKYANRMRLFRGNLEPAPIGDDPVIPPPPSSDRDVILLLDDSGRGIAVHWEEGDYHWYPVDEAH